MHHLTLPGKNADTNFHADPKQQHGTHSTENHDDTSSNEQRNSANMSINAKTEVMVMITWSILVFGGHDSGHFREDRHCDWYGSIQFGFLAGL